MKILVIGNGFDLEHELPTNYIDFLRYIKRIRIIKDYSKDDSQKVYIEKLLENDETFKEYALRNFTSGIENKRIEELINLCNNNDWIKYFEEANSNENKGWIDFEGEISHVIRSLDYMKKYRHETISKKEVNINKNKDYNDTEKRIERITGVLPRRIEFLNKDEYNQKITKKLQENLENLIRCLELYLEDYVAKKDINYISPDIKGIQFDKVLSFNYTNTYERIYGFNSSDIEYHYIHGKADIDRTADDNNMVLGIDEYLDNEVKNKELEFIAFKKYFQRIYKKTGNTYKKWIKKINEAESERLEREEIERRNIIQAPTGVKRTAIRERIDKAKRNSENEIYIFGHSLDITDKDILKELIECPNTITTIFYYNKGVYAQQIANLVKVIGQDELIQRVSGANPTIIFKQQQQKNEIK
ncbi:AbiH family protein [Clostridium diolis]|uniref:AbiH family protein n=1 Tax=Clostridium diolis TaxID=223919 RepID=UPI003AF52640